ncbi:MAG: DUF2500 family protein [Clostridia bacterium]|nr:DUF2500 family protein [Clostridia bacterium]
MWYITVNDVVSGALLFLLLFGIPAIMLVLGIILLVRVFMPGVVNTGRKATTYTVKTRVLGRREHHINSIQGNVKYYYITFALEENDKIELKVSKSTFNSVDYDDIVKLTYAGERFKNLSIIERSGKKTVPTYTSGTNMTDII